MGEWVSGLVGNGGREGRRQRERERERGGESE